MMNIQEIKELIQLVVDSGVAELEVQRGEDKVRIRRSNGAATDIVLPASAYAAPVMAAAAPAASPAASAPSAPAVPATTADMMSDPSLFIQKAPIVGTFYESPKPGSPTFVRVGDHVQKGKVLCIIESMKLMNEIEAEESGAIVARLVENGHPVEYGEGLFAIKPD